MNARSIPFGVSLLALCVACSGSGQSGADGTVTAGAGGEGAGGDPALVGGGGGLVSSGGTISIDPNAPDPNMAVNGKRSALCTAGQTDAAGYRMLRRLSQGEYNNTLRDVFGYTDADWVKITFPGEIARRGAYENYSDALTMNEATLAVIVQKSFDVADQLVAPERIAQTLVTPCVPGAIDPVCADAMVQHYGYRLYRRPLSEAEVTGYSGLFAQGLTLGLSGEQALAGVLASLIHAPGTLYIEQLGAADPAGGYTLGPYEVAAVLAYGLTGSSPAADLLDRAGAGALSTQAGIQTEIETLIASPAGQEHLREFLRQWLGYDRALHAAKSAEVYPIEAGLTASMVEEDRLLIESTLAAGQGITSLLTNPNQFVNASLAAHYGMDATGLTEDQFVQRPRTQGAGYLTSGAFLTKFATSDSSSPTQRGVFVLQNLLCRELGQPPPVVPEIVPPSGEITTRQRYEEVHGVDECAPCHSRMDPIGFAFENFDGVGRYRTQEVGQPIDASGKALDLAGAMFNGPEELISLLVQAPQTHQCVSAQLASFVFGLTVQDGLCVAPAASYATTEQGFSAVLSQVAAAPTLTRRR